MILPPLFKKDLDYLFSGIQEKDWFFFLNKNIFITGGTGFIGKLLISALLFANKRLNLNLRIKILTRSKKNFCDSAPHIAFCKNVSLHEGDIRNFKFPDDKFDIIIHGATDIEKNVNPGELLLTCVEGTKRVMEFCKFCNAKDFLLTSSGAVYGLHPAESSGILELDTQNLNNKHTISLYGEAKKKSEEITLKASDQLKIRVKIARIYAQVGPYLPLDKHFAIGNFINDACSGREIIIRGNGSPIRSYMYSADLSIWLLTMIVKDLNASIFNVGGDEAISIADLAERVAFLIGSKKGIKILNQSDKHKKIESYVPNTSLAK